jgi:hypothetical protein
MFGKNKKEKEWIKNTLKEEKEKAERAEKQAEQDRLDKRKQDYFDEKMKLTEKELFVELLWHLEGAPDSLNHRLYTIGYNTDMDHVIRTTKKYKELGIS